MSSSEFSIPDRGGMSGVLQRPVSRLLQAHQTRMATQLMRDMFMADPARCERFSLQVGDMLLDYSKNRITDETMELLVRLAEEADVAGWRERMFRGDRINTTENRAVLHVALRNRSNDPVKVDGEDVMPKVNAVIERMGAFAERVRSGKWRGYTGKAISDVVNIGIGGSDLGPQMVVQALKHYRHHALTMHFVSNVDGTDVLEKLERLNPETTLFIVASKTFTTQETMTNAHDARDWFLRRRSRMQHIARHFVARVHQSRGGDGVRHRCGQHVRILGLGGRALFAVVGDRFVHRAGGGHGQFVELLGGAHEMDGHFRRRRWRTICR